MFLTVKFVKEGEHTAMPSKCFGGGAYCLVKSNGEVFATPTTYGRNATVKRHMQMLADSFNQAVADQAAKRGDRFNV